MRTHTVEEEGLIWTVAYGVAFAVMLHASAITSEETPIDSMDAEQLDESARLVADRMMRTILEKAQVMKKAAAAAAELRTRKTAVPREEDPH